MSDAATNGVPPDGETSSAPDPIDWELAARVARWVAGRQPRYPSYAVRSLEADFRELTAEAEALVQAETGLVSQAGPARARVADRELWVQANLASFRRLLAPLTDKLMAGRGERSGDNPLERWMTLQLPLGISQRSAGTQVGLLLGWMSTRVLGQYDQLLIEDEHAEDQDIVYYVGPNILELERRYDFPQREFRLWLALHEVTHRAQFTGVPWMRGHFLDLVHSTLSGVTPDPRQLLDALRRAAEEMRAGRNPLDEGGLLALLASPEQRERLDQVAGLMSLLEGHGDIIMDRAGAEVVPNAAYFSQILKQRRAQRGAAKMVSSLVGIDAKLRQYEQGEQFVEAVEQAGGRALFSRVWESPQWLPSWDEIRDPTRWISRAGGVPATS